MPIATAAATPWRKKYPALARFTRNRIAVVAAFIIFMLLFTAAFGPVLYRVNPATINEELISEPIPPGHSAYLLGTDYQGRDMLARLLAGAQISLAVGLVSCMINLIIGVGVGVVSGWGASIDTPLGKAVDTTLMRGVDILQSLPLLLVVILLQIFVRPLLDLQSGGRSNLPLLLSPDLISIYIALGFTNWLTMARLTRGEVMNQYRLDYVLAAKSLGQRNRWILFRHILPNCIGPLAVAATLAIPEAIFVESFLAFVGIGVSAPQASWGTMASDGLQFLNVAPHLLILPAIFISITMLSFNLFGDGLRDALDPSSR